MSILIRRSALKRKTSLSKQSKWRIVRYYCYQNHSYRYRVEQRGLLFWIRRRVDIHEEEDAKKWLDIYRDAENSTEVVYEE